MSLNPSASDFQPILSHVIAIPTDSYYTTKENHVLTVPELGYEFPHTLITMPVPSFTKVTPSKRVWTEMATSFSMYLKRY